MIALWAALFLTILVHIWVDEYFRRVGHIGPLVNGKSLLKAMADGFLNMTLIWTVTLMPAMPSLAQWVFLHFEPQQDGLHYRYGQGSKIIRGFADWSDVALWRGERSATINLPRRHIAVPSSLSHYAEFIRDVESRCPQPTVTSGVVTADNDLSAGVLDQIRAELRAGRKIQAIKIVRQNTGLGLMESKNFIEQWERESSGDISERPPLSEDNP